MEMNALGPEWQYIPDENWEMQLVDVTKIRQVDDSINKIPFSSAPSFSQGLSHGINHNVKLSISPPSRPPSYKHFNTEFILYTRSNPNGWPVKSSLDSLKYGGFNSSLSVRFVIHGWNSQSDTANFIMIRESFLAVGDYNVIM